MPLIDESFFFRLAESITFFILWHIALLYYIFFMQVKYEGKNKLKNYKGNAILVSNHTTFLDPVLISGAFSPYRAWHTLLEKTVETPFLGTLTRLLGGVPLPPGGRGIEKLIETAPTAFRYKRFIHFYPEGECFIYSQKIAPFKTGAFYVAAKLNIPVFPVLTVFYEGKFPKNTFFGRKIPKVRTVVLDPIDPKDYTTFKENNEINLNSVKHFAEEVRRIMQTEIENRHTENAKAGTNIYFKGQMPRIKGIN
ncbi:MAG: 1-acyl-sn-glycerol-3-phosphate acyltransferase [Spirochaetaceae bacterium]|nr:1-acyl-sn-glycerol-3-phosphate acyltransferase [Spirochaetaceae bacterium]